MAPKISVLIPLYNRREYAAECVQSVLSQSFSDFEIIIRDDCSTDGVYEFVAQNFLDDRIKLYRNEKNLGEAANVNLLIESAAGKYFTILHNDDLYLPDALRVLYETAEKFGADVVHAGNILSGGKKICVDGRTVNGLEILSDEPALRFSEWFSGGIFRDVQYNLFRREFISGGRIFSSVTGWDPLVVSLNWIMRAKILMRTPVVFYIRRETYNSQSGVKNIDLERAISGRIEIFRGLDKIIDGFEYFRGNEELRYKIKARVFGVYEDLNFDKAPSYGDAHFAKTYATIERTFRKYFGDDAVYLALTYHWAHAMHFNQTRLKDCLKLLDRNI